MNDAAPPRIYYDPLDEPQAGSAILMTSPVDRRRKWRANSVEDCLRAFLRFFQDDAEDCLFRRVGRADHATLEFWEIPEPVRKGDAIDGSPGRMLGRYYMVSSFRRTVQIDPKIRERYGVQKVYMLSDEIAHNFSYLDRTGKIRPLNITVDGEAIEPGADEAFLREQVGEAIPHALEPVHRYSRRR